MEQGDSQGSKFDTGKLRYDLLPFDALEEVVRVISMGAAKYGDRNWEKGLSFGRLIAATLRHVSAYAMGQDKDKESGLPHMAHAATNCLFLIAYSIRRLGRDDRSTVKPRLIASPTIYWMKQKEGVEP